MSNLRDQLSKVIASVPPDELIADAIMEKYDLTPKPAITAMAMAAIMFYANARHTGERRGQYVLDELDHKGLVIVRKEDVKNDE